MTVVLVESIRAEHRFGHRAESPVTLSAMGIPGSTAPSYAIERGSGWIPVAGLHGNALLVAVDPALAYRLREASEMDPFMPLTIAADVHRVLRDRIEEMVER